MKKVWRLWAKALGQKAGKNDTESDNVAIIRSVIFLSYLLTNLFIIAGVLRHWNDEPPIIIIENEVPSSVFETQEKGLL